MTLTYTEKMTAEEYNDRLKDKVMEAAEPGDRIMFIMGAAKGKEGFYEKLGFKVRPNEFNGSGMSMWKVKE